MAGDRHRDDRRHHEDDGSSDGARGQPGYSTDAVTGGAAAAKPGAEPDQQSCCDNDGPIRRQLGLRHSVTDQAGKDRREYLFRATGSVPKFDGFLKVYEEGKDQKDEEDEELKHKLPAVAEGEALKFHAINPEQHFTEPPPRFNEATLVKELELNGVGRPSTYASILATIQEREYVTKEGGRFTPTELGDLKASMRATPSGAPIRAPPPKPMIARPVARPGRSGNHLMSVETGEMYPSPSPQPPITPDPIQRSQI